MQYAVACAIAVFGAAVLGFCIGGMFETDTVTRPLRVEAVKRGYAEWRVDPKTGLTTWAWKDKP